MVTTIMTHHMSFSILHGAEELGLTQCYVFLTFDCWLQIRLTEALQEKTAEQDLKPEQLEKLAKLEDWRKELKQLEDKKDEILAA